MFNELLSEGGLSLDRLKNFCAMAEAGGIAKVAGGDPAKQSLYSRQLRELEQFFGAELTRRKGKGIEFTEQGLELARQVRAHLQDGFQESVRGPIRGVQDRVRQQYRGMAPGSQP
jgi:LysR family transcriptional regulator, nitrogen assimilation regulatory protein